MRCPDCNKFVSLDFNDPELDTEPEFDHGGEQITAQIRIVRACADCGTELKGYDFDVEIPTDHLDVHEDEEKADVDLSWSDPSQLEEGGGRYAKSYYGAELEVVMKYTDSNGERQKETLNWSDKVPASHMEELV